MGLGFVRNIFPRLKSLGYCRLAAFAYKNLDAMYDTTAQRFATIQAIKQFDSSGTTVPTGRPIRDLIEPTLTPATYGSVRATHVTSDILTIAALWAMELRRRRLRGAAPSDDKQ
jgi:hypothetical protein